MDLNRIRKLKCKYIEEKENTLSLWTKEFNKAKKELEEINKIDFAKEYVEMFEESKKTLDDIFSKWVKLQKKTYGLDFNLEDYYKSLKARKFAKGTVMEHVQIIVQEVNESVNAVKKSQSVKDDVEPQKKFAQAYVDMEYIVKNARKLLDEANIPQDERANTSKDANERYQRYENLIKNGIVKENLKVYPELNKLANELRSEIAKSENALLSPSLSHENENWDVLIGLKKDVDIDKDVLHFLVDDLGIQDADKLFSSSLVFFRPRNNLSTLLVKGSSKLFNSIEFIKVLKKLYFTFIDSFSPKKMMVFGMEQLDTRKTLNTFQDTIIKKIGVENMILEARFVESERAFEEKLQTIIDEYNKRESKIVVEYGYDDIYQYNDSRTLASDKINPILVIINNYPIGFSHKSRLANMIDVLIKTGGKYGIYTLLFEQDVLDSKNDNDAIIYTKCKDIDVLEINDNGETKYNDEPISFNIYASDFTDEAFINSLKNINENVITTDLLEFVKSSQPPIKPFYEQLSIPIGKNNGKVISLNIQPGSTNCNMFLGGASGAGKSYFLHSLMMNAAMIYGPDEVQFNIIDFKSSGDNISQDFGGYIEGGPLFIPHVRYLSFGNSASSGKEMIRKIKADMDQRDIFLASHGGLSFEEYNKKALKNGWKKMPVPVYIIDEANQMLGDSEKGVSARQRAAHEGIGDILKVIRSKNAAIIFAGQDVPPAFSGNNLGNMQTFIAFGFNNAPGLKSGFMDMFKGQRGYQDAKAVVEDIARQVSLKYDDKSGKTYPSGKFALTTNSGISYDIVSVAYGNKIGSSNDEYRIVAEMIRDKYPWFSEPQAIAGSKELIDVNKIDDIGRSSEAKDDERKYYLPFGVSSATMLLNELEYSNAKSSTNYQCVIEKSEKSSFIMKGLLLEIIKRNKTNKDFKGTKIYFNALPKPTSLFLKGIKEDKVRKLIEDEVTFTKDKYEMAKVIMDLYDEYLARKKKEESTDEIINFTPIFLFMSGTTWLTDDDDSWINEGNKKTSKPQDKIDASNDINDIMSSLPPEFSDMASMIGFDMTKPKEEKPKERIIDEKELKTAFATIFGLGNRYSIFVFAVNEQPMSFIKNELKKNQSMNYDNLDYYMIFDTYQASVSESGPIYPYTAYIIPSKSTSPSQVRLIDYSYNNNENFFKNLLK